MNAPTTTKATVPSSLADSGLKKGERKLTKKQAKAERKATRLADEMAEANTLTAINKALGEKGLPIDYVAILDFEATCDDVVKLGVQEVIEFPTLFVSTRTGKVKYIFHTYVRPELHPKLTPFCTQLTGISQETVDNGVLLKGALKQHQMFLEKHGLVSAVQAACSSESNNYYDGKETFIYATCGDWDLKKCLPRQLEHLGTACPPTLKSWCNLKFAFKDFYNIKPKGMTCMLNHVGLELEGRHHSGIDDCQNLARIVAKMLKQGWKPSVTGTTLRQR